MSDRKIRLGPIRKIWRKRIRYWSRSEAVSMLVEFGDATQLGGETRLQSMALLQLDKIMRDVGFVEFALHEDEYPNHHYTNYPSRGD